MKELKIHVERIVRPIRGSQPRKNKMREELLQHMLTAHEEAVKRGEEDPVAYAAERLGDPDALREELQATVPRLERIGSSNSSIYQLKHVAAVFEVDSPANAKVALKGSLQSTLVLFMIILPLTFGLCIALEGTSTTSIGWPDWEMALEYSLILLCMGMSLFIVFYLFRKCGLHVAAHASSSLHPFIKACITTAHWMVFVGLFLILVVGAHEFVPFLTSNAYINGVLLVLAKDPGIFLIPVISVSVLTFAMQYERRQYEEWGYLEIDE